MTGREAVTDREEAFICEVVCESHERSCDCMGLWQYAVSADMALAFPDCT